MDGGAHGQKLGFGLLTLISALATRVRSAQLREKQLRPPLKSAILLAIQTATQDIGAVSIFWQTAANQVESHRTGWEALFSIPRSPLVVVVRSCGRDVTWIIYVHATGSASVPLVAHYGTVPCAPYCTRFTPRLAKTRHAHLELRTM